jgi:hypothetical protein
MTSLAPANDANPASWVIAGLRDFAESVQSLVPRGFDAYVRLFHPAYRLAGSELTPVRWEEIAETTGREAHAGMLLNALTGDYRFLHHPLPGVYDQPPLEGSLPFELADCLRAALATQTTTPTCCWFAVWNGFGGARVEVSRAATFQVPQREYHLLTGEVGAVSESAVEGPRYQSPNLWWPEDRAWCVATEIDLNTTYVGCNETCREALLALPDAEARSIDPASGIDWRSDTVNPFE